MHAQLGNSFLAESAGPDLEADGGHGLLCNCKLCIGDLGQAFDEAAKELESEGDGDGDEGEAGGDDGGSEAAGDEGGGDEGSASTSPADSGGDDLGAGWSLGPGLFAGGPDSFFAGKVSAGKPPGFPNPLGLTTPNVAGWQSAVPQIQFEYKTIMGQHKAALKPTTSRDSTHPAVAAPAGDYILGTKQIEEDGKQVKYTGICRIPSAIATKVVQAEQEHLDDLKVAWEISYKAFETAINSLAGQFLGFASSEEEAREQALSALHDRFTSYGVPARWHDPSTWGDALGKLGLLSKQRDKGWHSFGPSAGYKPEIDQAVRTVVFVADEGTTQIGEFASEDLVSWDSI